MSGQVASTVGYDGAMAASVVQDLVPDPLTAHDRCDRCGAQAYIRARILAGSSELLFCAHHGREHKAKLDEVAVQLHDETEKLYKESQLMKQATTEV